MPPLLNRLDRRRRSRRYFRRIVFDLRHQLRNATFQLRILAGDFRLRIILDFDVGIDPVAFDHPLALAVRQCRTGNEDGAAVDKWPATADAHDTAPRTLADQWPKSSLAKHVRENVAVRSRILIEQRDHRSQEYAV